MAKNSCVLATTDGEAPHCSLMAYITDDGAERIYLMTSRQSRKYENVRSNPKVSLMIDTRAETQRSHTEALTVTGTCRVIESVTEIDALKTRFVAQHPHLKGLVSKVDNAVLCIRIDSFLLLEGPENAHFESLDRESPAAGDHHRYSSD